jgi:hypothetical protein
MEKVIVALLLNALLVVFCLARPRAGRIVIGGYFLLMALAVHGAVLLIDPQLYVALAEQSFVPLYRELALRVVTTSPLLFGLVVASFEVAVALLVLWKGRAVKIGLAGMILFLVGIVPLGPEVASNLVLAAGLFTLLRQDFDTSPLEGLRAWLRGRARPRRPALSPVRR